MASKSTPPTIGTLDMFSRQYTPEHPGGSKPGVIAKRIARQSASARHPKNSKVSRRDPRRENVRQVASVGR